MYFVYSLDTADYCQGFPGDKCKVKPSTISFYKAKKKRKQKFVQTHDTALRISIPFYQP